MKAKIIIVAMLFASLQIQANAAVSVEKTLSREYMLNSGYSEQIYDSANVSRARALGKEYYSRAELNYQNSSRPVRFWKRLHRYVDPAKDDYSFYHHDSKPEPSVDDL